MVTQDRFDTFFNTYNGKPIEAEDASNYAQCMDLAFKWVDFLGIDRSTIRHQFAYQVFTNPNPNTAQFFDIIKNTPTGVPLLGDLVVFLPNHISIFVKGDSLAFQSFEQNWDTQHFWYNDPNQPGIKVPYCRLVTHDYNGVLNTGWLHPKTVVTPQPDCTQQLAQAHQECQNKINDLKNKITQLLNSY